MAIKVKWVTTNEIEDSLVRAFALSFLEKDSRDLIANVQTEIKVICIDDRFYLPVTINDTEYENSYVCSPYTALVTYCREELNRNITNSFLNRPLNFALNQMDSRTKKRNINKVIHINNFLFSTNIFPNWQGIYLPHLTQFLTEQYPDHALIFRSLNEVQNSLLLAELERWDYTFGASRQVYLFHPNAQSWTKHNNIAQDKRLVRKAGLTVVNHEDIPDYFPRIFELYNQLYLKKYSYQNPQFTEIFYKETWKNNLLKFSGFKNKEGKLVSVVGLFENETTITSPIVGYDTTLPREDALYIHAMHLIFNRMHETGKLLNLSSGAAGFKRLRGGQPYIEYAAIYYKHLPKERQRLWKTLVYLFNKIGVPILKKYEL